MSGTTIWGALDCRPATNPWPAIRFGREITHLNKHQKNYGLHSQPAIENALKGWLSAADIGYPPMNYGHDTEDIANALLNNPNETNSLAGA